MSPLEIPVFKGDSKRWETLVNKVNSLGPEYHYMKELAIKSMVNVSVSKGYEKKDFWKNIANKQVDIDDEDAINNALTHINLIFELICND